MIWVAWIISKWRRDDPFSCENTDELFKDLTECKCADIISIFDFYSNNRQQFALDGTRDIWTQYLLQISVFNESDQSRQWCIHLLTYFCLPRKITINDSRTWKIFKENPTSCILLLLLYCGTVKGTHCLFIFKTGIHHRLSTKLF